MIDKDTLILALQKRLKENMEIPENVQYNEGIIDAIAEIEKQYALAARKQHPS